MSTSPTSLQPHKTHLTVIDSPPSAAYMNQSVDRVRVGSNNGLSPIRRQAIIWVNDRLLSFGPLGTNFSEILIKIWNASFTKMYRLRNGGYFVQGEMI